MSERRILTTADGCPIADNQNSLTVGDRGLPASYRHMNGYGSHTFSFINAQGERFWCKFHFKTRQGIKNLTGEESADLIGVDRKSHQRDLFEAIARGAIAKRAEEHRPPTISRPPECGASRIDSESVRQRRLLCRSIPERAPRLRQRTTHGSECIRNPCPLECPVPLPSLSCYS